MLGTGAQTLSRLYVDSESHVKDISFSREIKEAIFLFSKERNMLKNIFVISSQNTVLLKDIRYLMTFSLPKKRLTNITWNGLWQNVR